MKTLLHGSYFGYNFGDTLLCRLFCDWLKLSGSVMDVQLPLANKANLELIGANRRGLIGWRRAELLVLNGGGYLGEPRSGQMKWTVRAYKRHMMLINAARSRMPVTALAVGVGPLSSKRMRDDVVRLFEEAVSPVVRDETSADFLRKWGVRRDVEINTDAVVTASRSELMRHASDLQKSVADLRLDTQTVVGIHTEVHPTNSDLMLATQLMHWILQNTEFSVVLFSDGRPFLEKTNWMEKVAVPEEHGRRVVKVRYSGRPEDLMGLLDDLDLVITTKLHVGIVRCALGKPVIAAPAHTKTPRFYNQMNLSEWCVAEGSKDKLDSATTLIRNWIEGSRPNLSAFTSTETLGYYRRRVTGVVESVRGV